MTPETHARKTRKVYIWKYQLTLIKSARFSKWDSLSDTVPSICPMHYTSCTSTSCYLPDITIYSPAFSFCSPVFSRQELWAPNIPPPYSIFSQSGVRVKAVPAGLGMNSSPNHFGFHSLPACLIKLLLSAVHFSIKPPSLPALKWAKTGWSPPSKQQWTRSRKFAAKRRRLPFRLNRISLLFPYPLSCASACPRSKCQPDLGTWSGIWCHIARHSWLQKKPHSAQS